MHVGREGRLKVRAKECFVRHSFAHELDEWSRKLTRHRHSLQESLLPTYRCWWMLFITSLLPWASVRPLKAQDSVGERWRTFH